MENTVFYYEGERLIFLTEEDARNFFFEKELYHPATSYLGLNEFLYNEGYNCEDVFLFDEKAKADVLADYHEALFVCWLNDGDEIIACDIYRD